MRLLIIAISILISCTARSQDDLANRLLEAEKRVFRSHDSLERNRLILDKVSVYIDADSLGPGAMNEVLRVDPSLLDDSLQVAFYWNASIIAFLNRETYKALSYIDAYEARRADSSVSFLLLKYMNYVHYDTLIARDIYTRLTEADPSLRCLQCIAEAEQFELRHTRLKQYASMIVPGSGMIMNGNVGKGTISLLLNAATVAAIVYMAQHRLIINAIGWGTNLAGKFYSGNIRLTEKLITTKETGIKNRLGATCANEISHVLEKYPLNFRSFEN